MTIFKKTTNLLTSAGISALIILGAVGIGWLFCHLMWFTADYIGMNYAIGIYIFLYITWGIYVYRREEKAKNKSSNT